MHFYCVQKRGESPGGLLERKPIEEDEAAKPMNRFGRLLRTRL